MAAPTQARRKAVHDARGDFEVHRLDRKRYCPTVHLRDGSEVRNHLSLGRPSTEEAGPVSDFRSGLVWTRTDQARGCFDGWRKELEGSAPGEPILTKALVRLRLA